jgi:hypothetical protein
MVYSGKKGRTIIFVSTKREANQLNSSSVLNQECQPLHGTPLFYFLIYFYIIFSFFRRYPAGTTRGDHEGLSRWAVSSPHSD